MEFTNFSRLRRLELAVRKAGQAHGLQGGNPFFSNCTLGTAEQELTAISLYLMIPKHVKRGLEGYANTLCQQFARSCGRAA